MSQVRELFRRVGILGPSLIVYGLVSITACYAAGIRGDRAEVVASVPGVAFFLFTRLMALLDEPSQAELDKLRSMPQSEKAVLSMFSWCMVVAIVALISSALYLAVGLRGFSLGAFRVAVFWVGAPLALTVIAGICIAVHDQIKGMTMDIPVALRAAFSSVAVSAVHIPYAFSQQLTHLGRHS